MEEGIWKGCGHKRKMVLIDGGPVTLSKYIIFTSNNPKELCWECWKNQRPQRR